MQDVNVDTLFNVQQNNILLIFVQTFYMCSTSYNFLNGTAIPITDVNTLLFFHVHNAVYNWIFFFRSGKYMFLCHVKIHIFVLHVITIL